MKRGRIYTALISAGVLLWSFSFVLGHHETQSKPDRQRPQAANPGAAAPDPAAAFTGLIESVMRRKETIAMPELPQHPYLFQFLTAPPKGRYEVKQLSFTKGDEVRALSVAVHPPHDVFLTRGKEVGKNAFEGMYYVIDRTGWLKGAAVRGGKTITEILRGDAWGAYEREKAFWMWQAEQMAGAPGAGR